VGVKTYACLHIVCLLQLCNKSLLSCRCTLPPSMHWGHTGGSLWLLFGVSASRYKGHIYKPWNFIAILLCSRLTCLLREDNVYLWEILRGQSVASWSTRILHGANPVPVSELQTYSDKDTFGKFVQKASLHCRCYNSKWQLLMLLE